MSILCAEQLNLMLGSKQVLSSIHVSLEPGRVYAIVGPNGAGKSSLLKTLSGEIQCFSGKLSFGGHPLSDIPKLDLARALAVLPQSSSLNFPFTVREVVSLARTPHASGKLCDERIITEAIRALDIADLQQRFYTQLSGGEKQRTQAARVLAQIWRAEDSGSLPRLLLLDEPTAYLDLGHQQQLLQQVMRFASAGTTVVMVLHDLNLAVNFADEVIAMHQGEIVAQGDPGAVVTTSLVQNLFSASVDLLERDNSPSHYVLRK